jgi:uncharacterized membrane-anchored protein
MSRPCGVGETERAMNRIYVLGLCLLLAGLSTAAKAQDAEQVNTTIDGIAPESDPALQELWDQLPADGELADLEEYESAFVSGPVDGAIGTMGALQVPAGFLFADGARAQSALQQIGDVYFGNEIGIILPEREENFWYAVFTWSDTGYIEDEDQDLDADNLLEGLRDGNEQGNATRTAQGLGPLQIVGWEWQPSYNATTHNLEWATKVSGDGVESINHSVRILGRRGVMEVTLVVSPEQHETSLAEFRTVLQGYGFVPGSQYGDYQEGDRMAEFGLAALVTGGIAAVALKSGLLGKLWKFILFGLIAVGAVAKKIFGGKSNV